MFKKIFRQPQFFQISIVSVIMLLAFLFAQSIRAEFMRQTGPDGYGYGYGYGRGKGFGSIYDTVQRTRCYGYGYGYGGCVNWTENIYHYGVGYRQSGVNPSERLFGYGYGYKIPESFDAAKEQYSVPLFRTGELEQADIITPSKVSGKYKYVFDSQVEVRISDPQAGDLVRAEGSDAVYYLGSDGKRYVFPNETVFRSWGLDTSDLRLISRAKMESYPLGPNIVLRPGSKLIKITTWPVVFAIGRNGDLVTIPTETDARSLYGDDWAKRIIDMPDAFFTNYRVTGQVATSSYPVGSLVRFSGSSDVYLIDDDHKARKFVNDYLFSANRFSASEVIASTLAKPQAGTDVLDVEMGMIDPTQGSAGVLRLAPTPELRLVIPKDLVYTANEQSLSFEKIIVNSSPGQEDVPSLWQPFGALNILTTAAPEIDRPVNLAIHVGSSLNGQNVNFYFKKLGLNFERSCVVAQGECSFSSPDIFNLEVKAAISKPLAAISSDATSTVATTSAVVSVNQGLISAYRYSLDGGAWSPAMPASEDLKLTGLAEGSHQLKVIGRDSFGNWQDTASPTVKDWTIVLPPPPPIDNNQGGNSGGSGGVSGGGAILSYPLTTVANTTRPLAAAVAEQLVRPAYDSPKALSGTVLGVKITTDSWQELRDGASAIVKSGRNLQSFLDYNQTKKDVGAQKNGIDRYLPKLMSGLSALTQSEKYAINNFIVYGTPSTAGLGANERSYAVESHKSAYGRLPKSEADWLDCLAIAVGRVPNLKNSAAEAKASIEFKKIYKRPAADGTKADMNAIDLIAYGLRPARNQAVEERAFATFHAVYQRAPKTNWDWQLVRAIAYSGAKR